MSGLKAPVEGLYLELETGKRTQGRGKGQRKENEEGARERGEELGTDLNRQ